MFLHFPEAIDGGWSEWSDVSGCEFNSSAQSWTRLRNRKCDNPTPENDGFECPGSSVDVVCDPGVLSADAKLLKS